MSATATETPLPQPLAQRDSALPPRSRMPKPMQTLGWMTRPAQFLEGMRDKYGDTFQLTIGRETFMVVSDPVDVKQVFTGDPAIYHAGKANLILRPFLGHNSVLLVDDEQHLSQRKLLLPPFHGEKMRRHVDLMREIAEAEVARWPKGEPFVLHPRMQAVTLEVIMRLVFGIEQGDPNLATLRERLRTVLDVTASTRRMVKLVLRGPVAAEERGMYRDVLEPVDAIIADVIAERRTHGDLQERDDVLSMLLLARHEDGTPMDGTELRDELVTLLVAGHETTATALAWAIERLTRHPEALDRLTEETRAGSEEYVEAVIRETLRLRPVVPFVGRVLQQPQTIAGYDLPAGSRVAPSILLVHRREDLYPDAAAFRPERWLGVRPNPYTFIPFGGGVRRCLGASFAETEMRAVLAAIVSNVRLRPAAPESEKIARRVITLVPSRGAEVHRHAVSRVTTAARLTRKERQQHTRTCLLESAGRVFAREGLAHASVDDVAADAGFTKGAVYANFGSKEELFLAMLEERGDQRLVEMDRVLGSDEEPAARARIAGRDFVEYLKADPEWERLFLEASLHASRNEAFRVKLIARHELMHTRMTEILRRRLGAAGLDPGVPFEQLATMVMAMANGLAFERMVVPGLVPDDLFSSMLELFTLGVASRPRP
jgi:cytochrome P450/AcrR family transcriptional regulator